MNDCEHVLEVLPWYAVGKLGGEAATSVSEHLRSCDACRLELAEVLRLRHGLSAGDGPSGALRERVWRRVQLEAGIRDVARIDVGSLAIGFRLGLSARRSAPVRASLRVMGQEVRIVGRKRGPAPQVQEES
ncbi:MAG: zf-HC2 domain-containing protein [Candidatus Bipolaricaulis sp.]|nr:zf-HC2 domain-containing protein [Candidatus Bipolaricaulis sp.]MDD5265443.1 zf-HC2 domain-containing protein [Candidatus Bipolaricaulis sp.]MDD5646088.1 zf-HC2 domain-containing protein [Candidatus Bipolaricaulis sp.]